MFVFSVIISLLPIVLPKLPNYEHNLYEIIRWLHFYKDVVIMRDIVPIPFLVRYDQNTLHLYT